MIRYQKGKTSPLFMLNQQGPLKLELDQTDSKFDIRPGGWKKMVEFGVLIP